MVRPIELLLCVWVDELREKSAIKRGVLANKNSFLPLNPLLCKNVDDRLRNALRIRTLRDFIPSEAIDAQAFWIALFPRGKRLRDEGLVPFFQCTALQIHNLERDLKDPMDLRVKPVRFCVEKDSYHDLMPKKDKQLILQFLIKKSNFTGALAWQEPVHSIR